MNIVFKTKIILLANPPGPNPHWGERERGGGEGEVTDDITLHR